jgi:hypothetical protein
LLVDDEQKNRRVQQALRRKAMGAGSRARATRSILAERPVDAHHRQTMPDMTGLTSS